MYDDRAGEYRWRLRHDNGNILGDGSEGYASRSNARRAIGRVRDYVGPADYLWFDPVAFEVYRDQADEFRWRLVHRNGNVLADSGESYTRRHDASRAVTRLRDESTNLISKCTKTTPANIVGGSDIVTGTSSWIAAKATQTEAALVTASRASSGTHQTQSYKINAIIQ